MNLFHLHTLDRGGRILHRRPVEAADVYRALAHANRSLCRMMEDAAPRFVDPDGRIEVADCEGRILARVMCAEAIATMPLCQASDAQASNRGSDSRSLPHLI
ncbi:DUF6894 family protein [Sphingomonas sp.]|uniref:DUF6894 family protein n=1 Tax=Sphingomonas sp. TaxID=28214 RepID=UPI0039C954F2